MYDGGGAGGARGWVLEFNALLTCMVLAIQSWNL